MRTRIPRAAAAAANASMAKQAKAEEKTLAMLIAAAIGDAPSRNSTTADTVSDNQNAGMQEPGKRPARAAAVAANAGIARQVKEEERFFNAKKRPSATTGPTTKRSRLSRTKSKKVTQDTRKIAGKKRRQAAVNEATWGLQVAPAITDLPPLPFSITTSSNLRVKGEETSKNTQKTKVNKHKTRVETKENRSPQQVGDQGGRRCEFCRKMANICVLMHCTACRRAYHAKCLVHAFKPYVDENTPILDQIDRLWLEHRGNIFRCASCKAAFVDFYESGGYLWDCDCPTCSQPEKLRLYRQRKLMQMINDAELKKQRKQEQKCQVPNARKNNTGNRSNSASHSRRSEGSSTTPGEQVIDARAARRSTLRSGSISPQSNELMTESGATKTKASAGSKSEVGGVEKEATAEHVDVDAGGGALEEITAQDQQIHPQVNAVVDERQSSPLQGDGELCQQTKGESESELEANNKNIMPGHSDPKQVTERDEAVTHQREQPNSEPQDASVAQPTMPQRREKPAPRVTYELVSEAEQPAPSGDKLVSAVRVQHDDKTSRWRFPIMCSRTSSLRESGVMKSGKCIWSPKKMAIIQCDCCDKQFNYAEFVHHTDSRLVKNVKNANEDPMPYLFVEHRDTTQHTPLENFLPALRSWAARQSLNNTPTKSRRSHSMRQEALAAAIISTTTTMTNPEASTKAIPDALSRLRTLALFKRPKHRSDKTSIAARLSDPASLDFLAQVVCLPPKYVMRMVNGSLADRAACSETPVPGHSFPRKPGWLAFNHLPLTARHITCMCCEKSFSFDGFAEHAGIVLRELKQRSRQLLYVVERQNDSVLSPFNTFVPDLDTAAKVCALDLLLDELNLPPACPRPIC